MANEITININDTLKNLLLVDSFAPGAIRINQALNLLYAEVVPLVAGVDTLVTFAGITTPGIVHLYNLDPNNYVQWGPNNAGAILVVGRLKPSDAPAVFRCDPGATIRLKANTGNCNCLVKCWND